MKPLHITTPQNNHISRSRISRVARQCTTLIAMGIFVLLPLNIVHAQQENPDPGIQQAIDKYEATQGWLGIKISPVPDTLKAHLNLQKHTGDYDGGVMILNISRNSPAYTNGLDRYDVIVSMNDKPVGKDIRVFFEDLKEMKAGEEVKLTFLRQGDKITKAIKLIKPVPKHTAPYVYQRAKHKVHSESNSFKGGFLIRSDKGWQWQDFKEGDPAILDKLPPDVRYFTRLWKERMDGSVARARTRVHEGDRTIEIELGMGDMITVKRTYRGALTEHTETRKYKNAGQLSEADPAAYMVFQRMPVKPVKPGDSSAPILAPINEIQSPIQREFTTNTDGTIVVTITRDNQSGRFVFTSPEDLQARNPKLHEHYLKARALLDE